MSALKIRIRKHQHRDKNGNPILIASTGTNKAEWISGSVDPTWYDVTDDIANIDSIRINYDPIQGSKKISHRASFGNLTFTSGTAQMIKDWMLSDPAYYLNFFDLEIIDTIAAINYTGLQLKSQSLEFKEDDGCYVSTYINEGEDKFLALKKLSIHDNWQKWFSEDGTKNHPTFQVVIEQEATAVGMKAAPLIFFLSVIGFVGAAPIIGDAVNALLDRAGNVNEKFKRMLGFGRYHPAPRIYDILLNGCMKAGLGLNTPFDPSKELYNDCLFIPYSGAFWEDYRSDPENRPSPSTKHIWNNRYIWQFDEFIDSLCELYGMEWDIVDGVLLIRFTKDMLTSDVYLDLTDANKSVEYDFNLTKKPAYGRYEYTADGGDSASNQVSIMYNDIVDYDGATTNPILDGSVTKQVKFAPTSFYGDSVGEHYVAEVVQVIKMGALAILASLLLGCISLIAGIDNIISAGLLAVAIVGMVSTIITRSNKVRGRFDPNGAFNGIIRLRGTGQVSIPRIIRYDPKTPLNNARAVSVSAASIQPVPFYNPTNKPYATAYSGIGFYQKVDKVFNYPLFFDANYKGNLYDSYHEVIDSPMLVNTTNTDIKVKVEMCSDYMRAIGVGAEADTIIGKIIKVKDGYFLRCREVEADYAKRTIEFKGVMIRK